MSEPNPLPYPDQAWLDAATGWLMLGLPQDALLELAKMDPVNRVSLDVLELEWGIHAQTESWMKAREVAETILRLAPERSFGWIHLAYSLRRVEGGGLESAWNLLRPAFDRFPQERMIAYNLACYAAQMGRLDDGWEWLLKAVELTGQPQAIKEMALHDSDLEPLWNRIREW